MSDIIEPPAITLSSRNADLMAPIMELLRESKKDAPTKVGVLIDAAAAILATVPGMETASELRATSEEMRKRLIQVTRLHQAELEVRQRNATATMNQLGKAARKRGLSVVRSD